MHLPSSLVIIGDPLSAELARVLADHTVHVVRAETTDEAGRLPDCGLALVVARVQLSEDDPRCREGAHVVASVIDDLTAGPSRPRSTLVLVTYTGERSGEERLRRKTEALLHSGVQRAATTYGADLVVNALLVPENADHALVAERVVAMARSGPPVTTGEVLHISELVQQTVGDVLLARTV